VLVATPDPDVDVAPLLDTRGMRVLATRCKVRRVAEMDCCNASICCFVAAIAALWSGAAGAGVGAAVR
jgi:hypothetical protein